MLFISKDYTTKELNDFYYAFSQGLFKFKTKAKNCGMIKQNNLCEKCSAYNVCGKIYHVIGEIEKELNQREGKR